MKPTTHRKASGAVARLSIAAAGVAALLLSSCNLTGGVDPFGGANLVASTNFSSTGWGVQFLNAPAPASPSDYLTFGAVSPSASIPTTGLPSGATDISRLQIPNLIPNGDFQKPLVVGTNGWQGYQYDSSGNAVAASAINPTENSSTGVIDGTSLYYKIEHLQWISYNLSANVIDGFLPNAQYRIQFQMNRDGSGATYFEYNNGTSPISLPAWIVTVSGVLTGDYSPTINFPTPEIDSEITAVPSGYTGYFAIGTIDRTSGISGVAIQEGNIDNLTVTRVDIKPYIHLSVPYASPTGSRSPLVSGTYEFSLYAKLESAADVTPITSNVYDANGVTLGINTAREEFPATSLSRTKWTKLSMKTNVQISSFSGSNDVVLNLYVTPTEIYDRSVGSVLISSPSLVYLPNG